MRPAIRRITTRADLVALLLFGLLYGSAVLLVALVAIALHWTLQCGESL